MKLYDKFGKLITNLDTSKELARGGEGMIIDNNTEVVKIYLPGITPITEDKFNDLSALQSNIFVKPEKLVYSDKGKILGFTMGKVASSYFPILSYFNKTFCVRESISDQTKLNVAEKLIGAMEYAHSKNIIIGDYNPYNILVNTSGGIYLIDVDSYNTPKSKHSGLLFDEIRDYLYGGTVGIKSDYFSIGVIIFNMLTYMHPFKGINKRVPSIGDRMIKKLPIIKPDADLVIPKCYTPLTNPLLLKQFERMFIDGDRFVIKPNILVAQQQNILVKAPIAIKADELIMREVISGSITKSSCSKTRLALVSNGVTIIYDVSSKGNFRVVHSFTEKPKDQVFLCGETLYLLRDSKLYYSVHDYKAVTLVKDFSGLGELKLRQFGNKLIVVTENMMFTFNLDEIFQGQVAMEAHNVYGGRFVNIDGLFQKVANSSVLFYNKGSLNSVVLDKSIKNLYQSESNGILECLDDDKISYKLFSIKNLKVELFDCPFSGLRYFDTLNENMIVCPQDDKLSLIRTLDMTVLLELGCSEVSESSVIHCCNAGIVIVNADKVYITNRK